MAVETRGHQRVDSGSTTGERVARRRHGLLSDTQPRSRLPRPPGGRPRGPRSLTRAEALGNPDPLVLDLGPTRVPRPWTRCGAPWVPCAIYSTRSGSPESDGDRRPRPPCRARHRPARPCRWVRRGQRPLAQASTRTSPPKNQTRRPVNVKRGNWIFFEPTATPTARPRSRRVPAAVHRGNLART